uniref:Uncharacterized protein n=1 Tax=Setaria digitata TaxID=48799 RepID=A0A915PT65_9BILA
MDRLVGKINVSSTNGAALLLTKDQGIAGITGRPNPPSIRYAVNSRKQRKRIKIAQENSVFIKNNNTCEKNGAEVYGDK